MGTEFIGCGSVECSEAVWTGGGTRWRTVEAIVVPGIVANVWYRVIVIWIGAEGW